MKGTLIKRSEKHYDLYTDKGLYTSTYQWTKQGNLLSGKNCQAIEKGYDLDELARKYVSDHLLKGTDEYHNSIVDFKEGAKAILEIIGGKKYSEMDLMKAFKDGKTSIVMDNKINMYDYEKSLQQNEWEVEISEEIDKDGCLILKQN